MRKNITLEEFRHEAYALVQAELEAVGLVGVLRQPHTKRLFVQTQSETGDFQQLKDVADTFLRESVTPMARAELMHVRDVIMRRLRDV